MEFLLSVNLLRMQYSLQQNKIGQLFLNYSRPILSCSWGGFFILDNLILQSLCVIPFRLSVLNGAAGNPSELNKFTSGLFDQL